MSIKIFSGKRTSKSLLAYTFVLAAACAGTESSESPQGAEDVSADDADEADEGTGVDTTSDAAEAAQPVGPKSPLRTQPVDPETGVPAAPPPAMKPPETPAEPAPPAPVVRDVSLNGTGCPATTWSTTRAPNGSVEIHFKEYGAKVGMDSDVSLRECQLAIKLEDRAGFSYSLRSISYSGRATLLANAQAQLTTNYYFQGDPAMNSAGAQTWSGPYAGNYAFRYDVPAERAVWSSCDAQRDLNIVSRLRLDGAGSSGTSTLDLIQISGLQLAMRPCDMAPASGSTVTQSPPETGPSIVSVTRR